MSLQQAQISHPHIERKPDFAGGSPVIAGTKFPVRSVVGYVLKFGMTPEELVREFPNLTLGGIYDALSYYYDHKDEIEKDMLENTEEYWRERISGCDPTRP
jgi:uncharacterized protein (DUF433 family)